MSHTGNKIKIVQSGGSLFLYFVQNGIVGYSINVTYFLKNDGIYIFDTKYIRRNEETYLGSATAHDITEAFIND